MSSHGSVVKLMDLQPVKLGSPPAGTHMSHWQWQEGHLAKIAPMRL